MNLSTVVSTAKFAVGRGTALAGKFAPDILVGAGVIGFVGTVVTASKATLTINDVLDEELKALETIHIAEEDPNLDKVYDAKAAQRDKVIVYTRIVKKTAIHYAPAVIMGAASIACFLGAHGLMKSRVTAAIAAYETTDKAFKIYKDRVRDIFGDELADQIDQSVRVNPNEDGPDGKKIFELDPEKGVMSISQYGRVFGSDNDRWSPNRPNAEMFLYSQQAYFNDILKARGHLFLNEVYDALGFDRTPEGQLVGWVYNNKTSLSDNYVDIHYLDNQAKVGRDIPGYGHIEVTEFVLDFNVDGIVYNLI